MLYAGLDWFNPDNLTPTQIDPQNEGYRMLLQGERLTPGWEFYNKKDGWCPGAGSGRSLYVGAACTRRTKDPLPSQYECFETGLNPTYEYQVFVDRAKRAGLKIQQKCTDAQSVGSYLAEWKPLTGAYRWTPSWTYRVDPSHSAASQTQILESDTRRILKDVCEGECVEYWNFRAGWLETKDLTLVAKAIANGLPVRRVIPKLTLSNFQPGQLIKRDKIVYLIDRLNYGALGDSDTLTVYQLPEMQQLKVLPNKFANSEVWKDKMWQAL